MGIDPDQGRQQIYNIPTQILKKRMSRKSVIVTCMTTGVLLTSILVVVLYTLLAGSSPLVQGRQRGAPTPTQKPFNPAIGAILPTHRIVAFYGIPNAEPTGPAYELDSTMLDNLKAQGAAYQQLDPSHPVQLAIDLVASVPDGAPGPEGTYSHHLDPDTIQAYITFCQQNNLLLFLDLDFGWASVQSEMDFFLPYLERYSFVEMAIDPEWMFPRHDGIPGINLSNVRASDLNPIIQTLAELPLKYHVPRKVLVIHQYRGDGDGLSDPFDPGQAEIADKRNLLFDPRVDVVINVDSVGGYSGGPADKTQEYENWVGQDMQKYHNFLYGGFKLFYHIEAQNLMTPQQVLALTPPPMVISYGN